MKKPQKEKRKEIEDELSEIKTELTRSNVNYERFFYLFLFLIIILFIYTIFLSSYLERKLNYILIKHNNNIDKIIGLLEQNIKNIVKLLLDVKYDFDSDNNNIY